MTEKHNVEVRNDQTRHEVYLGLGSNLGDKLQNIAQAILLLNEHVGEVLRQSELYVSEPWGFVSAHDFVNACVCCATSLTPRQVLKATQRIERRMGRIHKSHDGVYHDRIIDIDILLYDDLQINEPGLIIPHPLMHQRDFVMIPLNSILPLPDLPEGEEV